MRNLHWSKQTDINNIFLKTMGKFIEVQTPRAWVFFYDITILQYRYDKI